MNSLLGTFLSLADSKARRGSDPPIFLYELVFLPSGEGNVLGGGKGKGVSWQVRCCGRVSLRSWLAKERGRRMGVACVND